MTKDQVREVLSNIAGMCVIRGGRIDVDEAIERLGEIRLIAAGAIIEVNKPKGGGRKNAKLLPVSEKGQ